MCSLNFLAAIERIISDLTASAQTVVPRASRFSTVCVSHRYDYMWLVFRAPEIFQTLSPLQMKRKISRSENKPLAKKGLWNKNNPTALLSRFTVLDTVVYRDIGPWTIPAPFRVPYSFSSIFLLWARFLASSVWR